MSALLPLKSSDCLRTLDGFNRRRRATSFACGITSMEKLFEKLHRFFNADYRLAVLDMIAGNRWIVETKIIHIPYLKAENAQGRHILIQPVSQVIYWRMIFFPIYCAFITSSITAHGKPVECLLKPRRTIIRYGYTPPDPWIWMKNAIG